MAQKVLVIQTAFLGDLLLSIPLIKGIRRIYPKHEIHLHCRKGFGSFFTELGLVDHAIEVDKSKKRNHRYSSRSSMKELKINEYDKIFCPHQSFRSAIIAKSLKAHERYGFSKWWNKLFFSQTILRREGLPDALRQVSLLSMVDSELSQYFKSLELEKIFNKESILIPSWASMEVATSHAMSSKNENIVFFAPGSVWNTKRWSKERYILLGQQLHQQGKKIIIIGSPEEHNYAQEIANQIPESKNIAGQPSLVELIHILRGGSLLVTNDNGAMHLGSVAGIPTIAIFGPTTKELGYRPWNEKAVIVEDVKLECRPCGKHGHHQCPLGTHDCMKNVSVEMVLNSRSHL